MAIVTGDRYLESLVRFVERNTAQLLEGSLTLKLNPVGLHYVQSRLEALHELEGLLVGAPVDYLRAYVSDLGDHRALEQLRRILRLLTSLKVISVLPPPTRDPTPLSLLPFGRLRVLELRGCDLSTSEARGLLELRHCLEKLICHNSTDALRHVFASRIVDIKDSPVWKRLSFVSCACNGLPLMDESLQLLPAVETLDLSRNRFAKSDNLRRCTKLQYLDLGFNHLRTIASLNEAACPIVKLVLRNNALTTLHGIENLKSIEGLDLSYNIISNFSELEVLSSLSSLKSLWLEGNPVCCAIWYRPHVFSLFPLPEMLELDGKRISTREYWEMQAILARRQKKPAAYGFYFPAKDDADGDSNTSKIKKKHFRLACIDEEQRLLSPDSFDQESVSCDSDHFRKDENAIFESEAEVVELMNKVEAMKKERSVLWLREFKEWLDKTPEDSTDGNVDVASNINHCIEISKQQMTHHHHHGKNPIHDAIHGREFQNGANSRGSDISAVHAFRHSDDDNYLDSHGKGISESSLAACSQALKNKLRIGHVKTEQYEVGDCSNKPLEISNLEAAQPFFSDVLTVSRDPMESKVYSEPSTVLEEIMGSHSSSAYTGSPPHYKEDILQRRQTLEEELLQLSDDSYSMASSDSDTSCSDDDSCRFARSFSEINLFDDDQMNKTISDHSPELERNNNEKTQDDSVSAADGESLLNSCFEPPVLTELLDHENEKRNSSNKMLTEGDDGRDQVLSGSYRKVVKRKPKKRFISLLQGKQEEPILEVPLSKKSNGVLVGQSSVSDGLEQSGCSDNDLWMQSEADKNDQKFEAPEYETLEH